MLIGLFAVPFLEPNSFDSFFISLLTFYLQASNELLGLRDEKRSSLKKLEGRAENILPVVPP